MRLEIRLADKEEYKEDCNKNLSFIYDDEPNIIVLVSLPNIIELIIHESIHCVITKHIGIRAGRKYDDVLEYRSDLEWRDYQF